MKKTLLMSAFMACAGLMSAQTLSFTVSGKPVNNGDEVFSYNVNYIPPEDGWPATIQLFPEVFVTSDQNTSLTVEMKNTSESPDMVLQMCWPTICQSCAPGNTISSESNIKAGDANDLKIDSFWLDAIEGVTYVGKCEITAYPTGAPDKKFSFKLTMQYPQDPGAVDGIEMDSDVAPVYYNLQGVRVENPENGLYIVKRGNKVSKTIIR